MLPHPVTTSRLVLGGVHMSAPAACALRCKAAVPTSRASLVQAHGLQCPATRIELAGQSPHTMFRHARTRCAAAETATELVSATERFVEEFQAADQRSESEQTGHLVSLEEQLQAVNLKVWMRTSAHW